MILFSDKRLLGLVISTFLFCISCSTDRNTKDQLPKEVSYNFHIRPILSDRCFKCHGPDSRQRKADLRLDLESEAFAVLKKKPGAHALVAGKPQESEVFQRISAKDTAEVMPPSSSNLSLTSFEIKLIKKWIEQGAKYEPHWALIPPKEQVVPTTKSDWPKNEIDQFIFAKMDEQNLCVDGLGNSRGHQAVV